MSVGDTLIWTGKVLAATTNQPTQLKLTVSWKRGLGNPAQPLSITVNLVANETAADVVGTVFAEWQKKHPYGRDIEFDIQGEGGRLFFNGPPTAMMVDGLDASGVPITISLLELGKLVDIRGIGVSTWVRDWPKAARHSRHTTDRAAFLIPPPSQAGSGPTAPVLIGLGATAQSLVQAIPGCCDQYRS